MRRWNRVRALFLIGVGTLTACGSDEPSADEPGGAGAGSAGASGASGKPGSGGAGSAGASKGGSGGAAGPGAGGEGGWGGSAGKAGSGGAAGKAGSGGSAGKAGSAGCEAGAKDCPCQPGGGCGVGLYCLEGKTCVDDDGYEGGPCLPDKSCHTGAVCDSFQGVCVHCEAGSLGCTCSSSGACGAGLACSSGKCVAASALPPKNPKCYTPCLKDLVQKDGTVRTCDSDGVIAGCIDEQTCVDGSCVNPGGSKPACESDVDCPSYQVCLSGGCYSNCEQSADCASGLGCYYKACRTPCQTSQAGSGCPNGMACKADDGLNGYCVAISSPSTTPGSVPTGGFTVDTGLKLTNVKTTGALEVKTSGDQPQEFTVRKLWHKVYYADGKTERVDAPHDPATGEYRECDPAKNECPLWWLEMGPPGATKKTPTVTFVAPGACTDSCPSVEVSNAGGVKAVRWEGQLEFSTSNGTTQATLEYAERPEGQWFGSMYYLGTFSDKGLDEWVKSADKSLASGVENALVQRWAAFRSGNIEGGWGEFSAVLTATRDGSWRYGNVAKLCQAINSGSKSPVCYPYLNDNGVSTYVQDIDAAPVPTGVSELPMAMNLKLSPKSSKLYTGRIETSLALHYAGTPTVALDLAGDPSDKSSCLSQGAKDCVIPLADHAADPDSGLNVVKIDLGGRYLPTGQSPTCAAGYQLLSFPWYVPGFTEGTTVDSKGVARRAECRDSQLPFNALLSKDAPSLNINLSAGNPVPDGLPRKRTLQFLDGALINQEQLFLLFREQYESFIPGQAPAAAYGYMLLKRQPANLKDEDFVAPAPATSAPKTDKRAAISCDPSLFEGYEGLSTADKVDLMLNGSSTSTANYAALIPIPPPDAYAGVSPGIHYLCEDTGLFDGGSHDHGPSPIKVPCPAGSKVTYFQVASTVTQSDIANQECQTHKQQDGRGSCQDTLNAWVSAGAAFVKQLNPVYTCAEKSAVYCDPIDRLDMRRGKTFYERKDNTSARALLPLRPLIDSAFRYKTRFRSTIDGSTVGFAPQICVKGSDKIPYCYDPDEITEARKRVDCLVSIYTSDLGSLAKAPAAREALVGFLTQDFSEFEAGYDGFERLYSELLVMLGDEAYTAALGSRFDLAGMVNASFLGSELEAGGIDVTGGAGAEMYLLYQAAQYYQLALDRLYLLGPNFQASLTGPSSANFVTSKTVSMYLDRLIGAAAQKGRTWGEIARRYQMFDRPDLARRVTERAYVATYLESALIARLMLKIAADAPASERAQIQHTIENAQRRYSMALLDMREVYATLSDNLNYFGYPADYIPFPQVDNLVGQSQTGFEVLSAQAHTKLDLAKQREETAKAEYRSGKVALAQFQSDLVGIRNNYENQLASLCGTFTGPDGKVYPAIKKYAQLGDATSKLGDPCGRMGNGDLYENMLSAQNAALGVKAVVLRHANILKRIDVIRATAAKQCKLDKELADIEFQTATDTIKAELVIDESRAVSQFVQSNISNFVQALQVANCEATGCAQAAAMFTVSMAAGLAGATVQLSVDTMIALKEVEIKQAQAQTAKVIHEAQCDATVIDAERDIALARLELLESELEMLRADYQVQSAISEVQRKANEAQRLQEQEAEANELVINVQAAQNDPNVRIYKQDSIENADLSFRDALTAAYRATKVFEYYTSQTYAKKDQLFLIRMVSAGQYNLENYMLELDNAFHEFEDTFGTPDTRVMVISLKDDILRIPLLDENSLPLSDDARTNLMREKLKDVSLLDSNGYLTLPFSTRPDKLSPLTRNHKIKYIEADIQGNKLGDYVARLYLRSSGTGAVRDLNDETSYFVLPERTAVINPSLQGAKTYEADVYRSTRHHDRPLINTLWKLIINQRDEEVNKDIDLQSVTDIRLLVYYTDFTALN